jgi:glycerophosphoryl diester phosphodiesterase
LHVRKEILSLEGVETARRAGLAVRVWTVNAQDDFKRLLDAGVDGVFTDFPERFLQIASSSDARPGTALPTDLD